MRATGVPPVGAAWVPRRLRRNRVCAHPASACALAAHPPGRLCWGPSTAARCAGWPGLAEDGASIPPQETKQPLLGDALLHAPWGRAAGRWCVGSSRTSPPPAGRRTPLGGAGGLGQQQAGRACGALNAARPPARQLDGCAAALDGSGDGVLCSSRQGAAVRSHQGCKQVQAVYAHAVQPLTSLSRCLHAVGGTARCATPLHHAAAAAARHMRATAFASAGATRELAAALTAASGQSRRCGEQ